VITLIIGGASYNITNLIDVNSISFSDAIDETLGSGGFVIPLISSNKIGYDMSKPIPRYAKVIIDDGMTMYYYVSEDIVALVRKGANKLYKHTVKLIEPTKLLMRRVIPNQTITQPKGNLNNYIYTLNNLDKTGAVNFRYGRTTLQGIKFSNSYTGFPILEGLSNDSTIIDGKTLKQVREYELYINVNIYNAQYKGTLETPVLTPTPFEFDVLIGGVLVKTESRSIAALEKVEQAGVDSIRLSIYVSFKHTTSAVNQVVSFRARTSGTFFNGSTTVQNELHMETLFCRIQTLDEAAPTETTSLDQVVDKLLQSVEVDKLGEEAPEFTLSDTTRARITGVVSPEFTWQGYTLYEALQECASYVAAQVYLGEDDYTTIYFYFYDDEIIEQDIDYIEEETHALSTDYITGLEINAENVIKEDSDRYVKIEPFENGFTTVRLNQDGGGQITDTTSSFTARQGIYRPKKFIVKGLAFVMKDESLDTVNFANTLEWDITNFVVEQTKWSALLNTSSANTRSASLDKGNTVYYVQGQNRILNLGYNDLLRPPAWNALTALNYAIVEAILCQAQVENPTYSFDENYKPSVSMFNLQMQLTYVPYSKARATVYRDDALMQEQESIMYFNEQSQLNDMKSLGDIAKKYANRKGNLMSLYKGYTRSLSGLLTLGMKNARGERLTRYNVVFHPTIKELQLEYTPYAMISAYRGVPSAYRQWQVPNDNLVSRRDKYKEYLYLSTTDEPETSIYNIAKVWDNFKTVAIGKINTYAKISLDYDGLGYTKVVEGTVDTQVYGNTLVISVDMADNYSAGAKLIEGEIDTVTVRYQQDSRYTDNNGRVVNVKVEVYVKNNSMPSGYENAYPDNSVTNTDTKLSELAYNINKDAREIMGLSQQIVFGSNSTDIHIFSGLAKYNGLAMNGEQTNCKPFLLKKGYFPTSDIIDFSQVILIPDIISGGNGWEVTVTGNAHKTRILSPIGEYEGYIWIETLTDEPIYAVRTSAFDSTIGGEVFEFTVYANTAEMYTPPTLPIWVLIGATTPDYTIEQVGNTSVCALDTILPSVNDYTVGDIIKIDVYRLCNESTEICVIIDPEVPATVFCRSEYYSLE
jgi:hypothetical protein